VADAVSYGFESSYRVRPSSEGPIESAAITKTLQCRRIVGRMPRAASPVPAGSF